MFTRCTRFAESLQVKQCFARPIIKVVNMLGSHCRPQLVQLSPNLEPVRYEKLPVQFIKWHGFTHSSGFAWAKAVCAHLKQYTLPRFRTRLLEVFAVKRDIGGEVRRQLFFGPRELPFLIVAR